VSEPPLVAALISTIPIVFDVARLSDRWTDRWPATPPVGPELRHTQPSRWIRFHNLPGSKRYADTDEELATVLARHNTVLGEMFKHLDENTLRDDALVFSCAWGDRLDRTRQPDLIAVDPEATFWRSDRWDQSEPDLPWTHLWVSSRPWSLGVIDPLLALVADSRTAGIIIAPPSLAWLYHPYDGGADVIAPSEAARDWLGTRHRDWRSTHHDGL
jgi:hypothetical protein